MAVIFTMATPISFGAPVFINNVSLLQQVKYDMLVVAVGSINNTFGASSLSLLALYQQ